MTSTYELPTPLGVLSWSASCEGQTSRSPDSDFALTSGARVVRWQDADRLVVDLLVTRYDALAPLPEGYPRCRCWGVEWRLHASGRATGPISLSARLPVGVEGAPSGDEDIAMTEFLSDGWSLAVAGLDDAWYDAQDRRGHLAPSWHGAFRDWSTPHASARVRSGSDGVSWELPGLASGESAKAYSTVAWCVATEEQAESATFLAVDVGPSVLWRAAGLRTSDPRDGRRRQVRERG